MKESLTRSFIKTTSWRIFNLIADFILVYLLTGKTTIALSFSIVSFVVTFIAYFLHERFWNEITWGKS